MTHEELVEKVAEGIAQEYGFIWHTLTDQPDTRFGPPPVCKEHLRGCARAAIKIVGEACAAEVPALAALKQYGTAAPALSEGFAMPQSAFKSAILSLTQGTKE